MGPVREKWRPFFKISTNYVEYDRIVRQIYLVRDMVRPPLWSSG
jgi:hypothetical protein